MRTKAASKSMRMINDTSAFSSKRHRLSAHSAQPVSLLLLLFFFFFVSEWIQRWHTPKLRRWWLRKVQRGFPLCTPNLN